MYFTRVLVSLHALLCLFGGMGGYKDNTEYFETADLLDDDDDSNEVAVNIASYESTPDTPPTPRPLKNFSNSSKNLIFIFGVPNSGVTTLAKALSESLYYYYISVDELLQNASQFEQDRQFRRTLTISLQQDYIISSSIVLDLLEKALKKNDRKAYIVDGFPETMADITEWEKRSKSNETCWYTQMFLYLACGKNTSVSRGFMKQYMGQNISLIGNHTDQNITREPDVEGRLINKFESFQYYALPLLKYLSDEIKFIGKFDRIAGYISFKEVLKRAKLILRRYIASILNIRILNRHGIIPKATTVSSGVLKTFRRVYPNFNSSKHRYIHEWTDNPDLYS